MSCKYNNCKHCGYKSECEIFKENADLKKEANYKIDTLCLENAELKEKLKNLASVAEVRLANWQKYEKENAELKEQIKMLEQGYVWHDYDAGEDCYEDSHEGRWVKRDEIVKLTEAKEIIRRLINSCCSKGATGKATAEAEQFLKEQGYDKSKNLYGKHLF